MDVASTFAVSVAPPPYQKEVDEARRDTQNRVSIPQLNESHGSTAQTAIGDRRHSAEESLLSAQQAGTLDAEDEIYVDSDGRRKRRGRHSHDGEQAEEDEHQREQPDTQDDGGASYEFDGREYAQDMHGNLLNGELDAPVKAGYDPITGYYMIPATRRTPARRILLRFREQNVHFLERFSDKTTAVGLINFALCRRYGSIIPHSRLGQVTDRRA